MEYPVKTTDKDGTQEWYLNGKRHRDEAAAFIGADGSQGWFQHGNYRRDDGPAYIGANGTQGWYQHGKIHRDDGPAWIRADGTKEYWLNDTELKEGSLALKLVQEKERRKEAGCGTKENVRN